MSSAPPPLKTLPKGKLAALAQLTSNDAAVQKLKSEATASTFFDRHSPAVRKRRETTRAEFELIMSSIFPSEPLWDLSTITEKTKIYLSTVIQIAKGRIDQLPRTDLLYQRKEAIYWWAMRMIPKFPTVLVNWQMLTNAHIGYLGVTMGLSREHRKKRNLTDAELEVLFEGVMSKTSSTANLKQHYLAWLLIWTCSARPGSFTVCPGYEEGSDLGTGMNRMEDETLRWSDVEFMRVDDAVCVQINFRYTKGQRNPYTKKISFGAKKFTFLPCTGNRYHLDLSTVITAVALERGLFHPIRSWSELRATELFVITKDAKVNRQAVFLASDVGRNQLLPEKPMREAALNPVLKAISTDVGLWERNTTYSLRRTAIVETRRLEGTEFAQQLAGHIPGSTTIYAYDDSPLSDVDMTALRLGEQGMSREDIRKTFSQMNTARIDNTAGLRAELKEFVEAEMRAHERYIHAEKLLDDR
jgi:integrase